MTGSTTFERALNNRMIIRKSWVQVPANGATPASRHEDMMIFFPYGDHLRAAYYDSDGYVGSQAVFSDLTFAELPQLASMNSDAQGVNLSLRRNGNVVILEGRVDLTSLTDPDADVELTVAFPGVVTSTNGDRVDPDAVSWKLKAGVVSTMTAQARYTDPNTRSFTGAGVPLYVAAWLLVPAAGQDQSVAAAWLAARRNR